MAEIREFAFRVICCAFICSVLNCFVQETKLREMIKLMCAFVLALTVIGSIVDLDLSALLNWETSYQKDAYAYRNMGEAQTQRAMKQRIKEEVEAYILAEANQINADISIEVTVGEEYLPSKVYLRGEITPQAKKHMKQFLESTLSLAKENQIWTG